MSAKQKAVRDTLKHRSNLLRSAVYEARVKQAERMRSKRKPAGSSIERKADNAEIADYLARNPPKVW